MHIRATRTPPLPAAWPADRLSDAVFFGRSPVEKQQEGYKQEGGEGDSQVLPGYGY